MSAHTPAAPQTPFATGRLAVSAAATVFALAGARWLPGGRFGQWLAIAAIAVAIWHGAFDGVLAEASLEPRLGARWKPAFYTAYLALGVAVLLLWSVAPAVALPAFLLYSALHFGTEGEPDLSPARLVTGTAVGLLPIAAACHWWPQPVAAIFALMLRGSANVAAPLTTLAGAALWPAVAVALLAVAITRGPRLTPLLLIAVELLLFRGCSPLVAFALFFCLWHTPEHLVATSLDRRGRFHRTLLLDHLRRGLLPWLVSLAGVAFACWLGRHELPRFAGIVFIALSALSVPHLALAELCRRLDRLSPPRPLPLQTRAILR